MLKNVNAQYIKIVLGVITLQSLGHSLIMFPFALLGLFAGMKSSHSDYFIDYLWRCFDSEKYLEGQMGSKNESGNYKGGDTTK